MAKKIEENGAQERIIDMNYIRLIKSEYDNFNYDRTKHIGFSKWDDFCVHKGWAKYEIMFRGDRERIIAILPEYHIAQNHKVDARKLQIYFG